MPNQTPIPTQINIAPSGMTWKNWKLVHGTDGFTTRETMEKYLCNPDRVRDLEEYRDLNHRTIKQLDALIQLYEAQMEAVGAGGVEPLRKCNKLHQIAEPAQDARTAFEAISRFMKCEWNLDWDPAGFYDDAKTDAAFTWFEQGYMRAQQAAAPQAVQDAVPATNHSETPNSSTIIVPYGWKLVPDRATPDWVANLEALPDWREAVGECIKRFLAAAPAHPAEGVPAQASEWDGKLPERLQSVLNALRLELSAAVVNDVEFEVRSHYGAMHTSLSTSRRMYGAARDRLEAIDAAQPDPFAATQPAAQGMEQDAARYRYLRETDRYFSDDKDGAIYVRQVGITSGVITGSTILTDEELDAAIDAALAAQAKQGGAA